MLTATATQKLSTIVQTQGKQALEGLVKGGDVAGLQKLGLNAIDAKILIADVQAKGFDQVFGLLDAHKGIGGNVTSLSGGQAFVSKNAGKTGGLGSIGIRGSSLEGIDPSVVQKFNLKSLALPKDIKAVANKVFEGHDVRIATAGYSASPAGTKYAEHTGAFLKGLSEALDPGFVSSPTTDTGSIDALTTLVGQQTGAPVLPITARDYVGYINPDNFPPELDQKTFAKNEKFVFSDGAKYNQATGLASNSFVCSGGRDVAVFDFMRAIESGNPAVLFVDKSMAEPMGAKAIYDAEKRRPNNASAYISEMVTSFLQNRTLPHPTAAKDGFGAFDGAWLDQHQEALEKLVKTVTINGEGDIKKAVADATAHIESIRRPVVEFTLDRLNFDDATMVMPSQDRTKAARFSLPIPAFAGEELRYPKTWPTDMRNKDGSRHPDAGKPHPKAGKPVEDWQGNPVLKADGSVPKGAMFFNYEDAKYQGVESTGDKILLFNRPSAEQGKQLEETIKSLGGPEKINTPAKLADLLAFAKKIGLDDRYDSNLKYAGSKLTALSDVSTGKPAYGMHLRANEMVKAVFVEGPAKVGDVSIDKNGAFFVLTGVDKETGKKDIRHVTPEAFKATYLAADGTPLSTDKVKTVYVGPTYDELRDAAHLGF
jgi:hypothetical protein